MHVTYQSKGGTEGNGVCQGAFFNEEGTYEEEIGHSIGAAAKVTGAMRSEVLERRELSREMKM